MQAKIVESLFSNRGNLDESYVSHVKIFEDAPGEGTKARFIIIGRGFSITCVSSCRHLPLSPGNNTTGAGSIHKAKENNNRSFSIGKTWSMQDLTGIDVVDVWCASP